ncbi:MAG: leucine-rich repeat domain-containing protein [Eubacteriales bacterium]
MPNCKTARKTVTIHRISKKSAEEAEFSGDVSEKGNGWAYQNGVLTITANGGFETYFEEVDDYSRAKKYQNVPYQVDCVVVGKNVTAFSMFAFGTDFYPTQMIVEEGNPYYAVIDGWLVNRKTNTLICATDLDHFEWISSIRNIPDFVQYINHDAFYPSNCIQQICLPNNVIGIGDDAFEDCQALQTIELPQNVEKIGRSAFNYCTGLQNVVLDSSVETIDEYAFYSCYNLEHINLKDTHITELNSNVFSCSGLKNIALPDSLQTIKPEAFHSCWYLESVTVCSDNIVIYDGVFSECDQLKTIVFTKGIPKWIGSSLFNETGKSKDGKCFISNSIGESGTEIPYPTILYTAAYANEWAPNGETEWKGYPIRELSAEEARSLPVRADSQTIVQAAPCEDNGYEAGNGWIFQDGTLLVTANGGLDDFTSNEPDENFKWKYTHFPDEVEYIEIGKRVSEITPFASYDFWHFSPREIRIEAGNPYFVCDNGWIVQKETGTLVGPENIEDFKGPIVLNNLPRDIRVIGASAFDLACLPYWYNEPERALIQQVDFPNGLETIERKALPIPAISWHASICLKT